MNNSKYYLQDKSYYHGNYMSWWAKDSKGYTANLDNAHQFTAEELQEMSLCPTDVAWLCSYVDDKSARCVNASHVNYDEMKEQESILLSRSDSNGWISVKDKSIRPPKLVYVLVLINGYILDVARVETFFENGEWVTDFENEDITHWQYAPQPPKG